MWGDDGIDGLLEFVEGLRKEIIVVGSLITTAVALVWEHSPERQERIDRR